MAREETGEIVRAVVTMVEDPPVDTVDQGAMETVVAEDLAFHEVPEGTVTIIEEAIGTDSGIR